MQYSLGRFQDALWNLSPWGGQPVTLNFGDGETAGRSTALDRENADLLRMTIAWRIWGIKSLASPHSIAVTFFACRKVFALCSKNNISARNLMRYPRVFDQLPELIAPAIYGKTIIELHRVWDARDYLGFVIVDPEGIRRLAAAKPAYETHQTAYIPPRIWTYQVHRLREFLDEYLAHKSRVEECFNFCLEAYAHNYGSLEGAMTKVAGYLNPFCNPIFPNKRNGAVFHGCFGLTAERFGIDKLLGRWVSIPSTGFDVRHLSVYLNLARHAGMAYIANFTLQRVAEASSLRADCLSWEVDEKLGRIPIIAGETTKTDPDSDARWPTSPSVAYAVEVMTSVARLRMRCAAADPLVCPTLDEVKNPYLMCGSYEPWCSRSARHYAPYIRVNGYDQEAKRFDRLFEESQLRITEEDLRIARMVTPNLNEKKGFTVGAVWPLAWHQLRRTGAVNMFASGILSDSSLQFQMKHASRIMPLYYGRGYARLQLNEDGETLVLQAMYEATASLLSQRCGLRVA